MDKERTWVQVDQIISLLNSACKFLDFPSEYYLNQYKAIEDDKGRLVNQKEMTDYKKLKKASIEKTKQLKKELKSKKKFDDSDDEDDVEGINEVDSADEEDSSEGEN